MILSTILPRMFKDGKPIATRTRALLELSVTLNKLDPNRPWEVIVRQWKKSRTNEQNAALFGCAYKHIHESTGTDVDEIHEEMCKRFFGTVEIEILGKVKTLPARTTTRDEHGQRDVLPWDRFSDFYTFVESEAAAYDIQIPPPDPAWKIKAKKKESQQ